MDGRTLKDYQTKKLTKERKKNEGGTNVVFLLLVAEMSFFILGGTNVVLYQVAKKSILLQVAQIVQWQKRRGGTNVVVAQTSVAKTSVAKTSVAKKLRHHYHDLLFSFLLFHG
jgi:hypothetical protein